MGRLSQAIIAAQQNASGVAPNAYVQFLRQAIDDVEAAEAGSPSLTALIDELVAIASAPNFSLHSAAVNEFAQKLGEAHFLALCAAQGIHLERIPETKIKTPDFKWDTDRGPIHFEVKTLSVVDGDRGIDAALESAFESQADLEDHRAAGARVATSTSEIAPYAAKAHKVPRLVSVIDTLLEKTRGNVKRDQFVQPNTFLVINLSLIPPSLTEVQALRPVYWDDSLFPTPVTGDLWMLGFGRQGMLIHDVPEFEGKPCIQGTFGKAGLLMEFDFIRGVLIVVHPWQRAAEVWGLFREKDCSTWMDEPGHPCEYVFKLVGDQWNDDCDSNGFRLNGDR
ncbi:hypothetical protein [Solimonas terrae]|uniref:Uncharacterized protein n=1 Tax=Solimonas terrae TaxID=1396819 RepID=A0A6M2BTF4_9GAMM|nr:hypothetical protein [Solimonas terrae]NGY05942.1 hypothetical protein [Solimonas terrae]